MLLLPLVDLVASAPLVVLVAVLAFVALVELLMLVVVLIQLCCFFPQWTKSPQRLQLC